MGKSLQIFIPTFIVVMIFNQMMYGACFKSYCIAAAFPKVVILSAIISAFIYYVFHSENNNDKIEIKSHEDHIGNKANNKIENDTLSINEQKTTGYTDSSKKKYNVNEIREKYKNAYKVWGVDEDELLIRLHSEGMSINEISAHMGRQIGGIKSRLTKHKLL